MIKLTEDFHATLYKDNHWEVYHTTCKDRQYTYVGAAVRSDFFSVGDRCLACRSSITVEDRNKILFILKGLM